MASTNGASNEKSYFEQQRELLVGDVAASLEAVLQNMNRLNRSLEGVIAVRTVVLHLNHTRNPYLRLTGRQRVQSSRELVVAVRERDVQGYRRA